MNSPALPLHSVQHVRSLQDEEILHFTNALLVLPERVVPGSITVHGGVITEITETLSPKGNRNTIDCDGAYLLPGLIELHTDNLERHIEPRPSVKWPHLPAILAHDAELASTGITTVFDALRIGSMIDDERGYAAYARGISREIIQARAEGLLKISHFLHLRAEVCSETLLEEFAEFTSEDRIGIVSLMDHTPGQRQFRDLSKLKAYVSKRRGLTDAGFEAHVAALRDMRERFGEAHEAGTVREAARLGAVLASHDDTTEAQVAQSSGKGVTFAEFPTTVEAAEACRELGIAIMMGAPNLIRGGSHSGNVAAADLARRTLLDIMSSDYVPSALLLSVFQLAELWDDLPGAVRCATQTPAHVTGLTDRGAIAEGLRGDLVCVSQNKNTPLIRAVWSRGHRVA